MSFEDFLNQSADIFAEAAPGQMPGQDTLGGADRTNYLPVVSGVSCLVGSAGSGLLAFGSARDDARRNVNAVRIYFATDPVPEGISSRHRIVVTEADDPRVLGTYAVQGVNNPMTMGHHFEVDCEMILG